MGLVGDPGLGERRHAGVAGECRAQDRNRQRRARPFAQPHAEVEQWLDAELLQESSDARPRRKGARPAHASSAPGRSRAKGATAAVQTNPSSNTGTPMMARGERAPRMRGKLAAAQRSGHRQWVVKISGVCGPSAWSITVCLRARPRSSTPVPRPAHARDRRRTKQPQPQRPRSCCRCPFRRDTPDRRRAARRHSRSSPRTGMPPRHGRLRVKSAVGWSSVSAVTARRADAVRAI